MCLIFISINQHPDYKLVVAANRDEFYNRKTAPAQFWEDEPGILGGRDLEAGGTWLGVTKQGKISMITNYRDPKNINPNAPSRGKLVSDFLSNETSGRDYLLNLSNAKSYNGFNLITGTADALYYFSNYRQGVTEMKSGLFGLSNHLLDSPWPKVTKGKAMMNELLAKPFTSQDLFALLYNEGIASDDLLPDTGVGLERERALSAMFIKSPGYGTRCSTVLLVDKKNNFTFSERVYDLSTFQFTEQTFSFTAS
ncbi:MAG TPA: NRDE family protein [Chryseosolibacter sp.]